LPGDHIILATIKSGSVCIEIKNLEVIMNIFIRSPHDPRKIENELHGGCDPQD